MAVLLLTAFLCCRAAVAAVPPDEVWRQDAACVFDAYLDLKQRASEGPLSGERLQALLKGAEACGDWATALDTAFTLSTSTANPACLGRAAWVAAVAGDTQAAATHVECALAADPNEPSALSAKALLSWDAATDDSAEAVSFIEAAVQVDPLCAEALATHALILLMGGEPTAALSLLRPVLEDRNLSPWPFAVAGACAWRLEDLPAVARWWGALSSAWPAHPLTRLCRSGLFPVSRRPSPQRLLAAAFTGDNRRVVLQSSPGLLTVADVADFDGRIFEAQMDLRITDLAWTEGNRCVLAAGSSSGDGNQTELWRWAPPGQPALVAQGRAGRRNRVLGCFRGGALYVSYWREGRKYNVEVRRLAADASDTQLPAIPLGGAWPSAAALAPDGDLVVFRSSADRLVAWHTARNEAEELVQSGLVVIPCAVVDSGRALALLVRGDTSYWLAGLPVDGFPAQPVVLLPGAFHRVALSPDGSLGAVSSAGSSLVLTFPGARVRDVL